MSSLAACSIATIFSASSSIAPEPDGAALVIVLVRWRRGSATSVSPLPSGAHRWEVGPDGSSAASRLRCSRVASMHARRGKKPAVRDGDIHPSGSDPSSCLISRPEGCLTCMQMARLYSRKDWATVISHINTHTLLRAANHGYRQVRQI